ncbi:MAG TPA: C4-type zinc ribbon domain-containing protein [Candidatus Desulfaltia sp.]|nr:C4-type zinc ribbon domain-containing protein [Candidatus Desulfaltia sp.]
MEIDFEKLIQLQQLDMEIRQLSLFLEGIPPQIENIDKKIAESSLIAAAAKEKMTASQKKRRELETEVKDIKAHIGKYKRQLNEVKTNKEYTALLKEIEESEKRVDRLEEGFIAEMLLEDDIQKDIKEANQKLAETQETLSREKKAIFQKKKEAEDRVQLLGRGKADLLPAIPAAQVDLYLNISRKKGGIVLSPVRDDFCDLCHVRIRPQVLNELLSTRKLILCENCGRILFWREKTDETSTEAEVTEAKAK